MKKQLQRVIVCLLLSGVLAGCFSVRAAAEFQDIPAGHWASQSIQRCVNKGFFNGETSQRFGLGHQMTRAAFVVVLCRFFNWETAAPSAVFSDVPSDAWYAGAVESARLHGAITDQREQFRPTAAITREELAVMLVRALGYGSIAGLAQQMDTPFTDVNRNAGYITMAYDLGLVSGTTATTFSPEKTATREQVAVILMRLYDKLHAPVPGTVAIVSSPADLTGLEAAAIPAARLFAPALKNAMAEETAATLLAAARTANVTALLHIAGGSTNLSSDPDKLAVQLTDAVIDGGYDGLFLDIHSLAKRHLKDMNELVIALRDRLGDRPLYIAVEAPARTGTIYSGYDYDLLGSLADRLVVRVAPYKISFGGTIAAPTEPLEEVYFALRTLGKQVSSEKLSLLLTTTPSAWIGSKESTLTDTAFQTLLAQGDTQFHYSDRYGYAYLTGTDAGGKDVTVWYPEQRFAQARLQLARAFGLRQLCLSNFSDASEEFLSGLE